MARWRPTGKRVVWVLRSLRPTRLRASSPGTSPHGAHRPTTQVLHRAAGTWKTTEIVLAAFLIFAVTSLTVSFADSKRKDSFCNVTRCSTVQQGMASARAFVYNRSRCISNNTGNFYIELVIKTVLWRVVLNAFYILYSDFQASCFHEISSDFYSA